MTLLRLIPYVALAPVGGVIADRYERRRIMIVSDALRSAVMGALALAVFVDAPVLLIGALALMTTAVGTAYTPSMLALVPVVVDEDDLASANSLASSIQCASIVVGPAIGGVLLAVAAPAWSFAVNATSFAAGALVTASVRARSRRPEGETPDDTPGITRGFVSELAGGARVVAGSSDIRVLMSLAIGASFVYGVQTVVLVILAGERVGHSASNVGYLYGALGLGGLLGAPIANRLARHARLGGVALAALGITAATLAALIPVRVAALAVGLVFVSGVGQVVVDVISVTMLQRSLQSDVIGRVFGIFDALAVGAMIAGSLLVAPLRGGIGYAPMLVVVAALTPALVVAQLRSLIGADRESEIMWWRLTRAVGDLRRVALFEAMQESGLERLARGATRERFAVGETIVAKGDAATHCYTVLHGAVSVHEGGPESGVIATLAEDAFFGEIGLLHDTTRTASITAATDCVCYAIDAETFQAAINADATVSAVAFEAAGGRLSALAARRDP
jgi:MFS family permease